MTEQKVRIDITPIRALIDDDIRVVVRCLRPRNHVSLVCRVVVDGARFYSTAYYESDENGEVDVKHEAALHGGSYHGVEGMGFIWSLLPEPGEKEGSRIMKSDVTTPIVTLLYVLDGKPSHRECLELIDTNEYLAHNSCHRIHMADGVQRIELKQHRLTGTLFIPAGDGPFPGVIDLFGSIGGVVEHRSALLASRGIASFALGYFMRKDADEPPLTDMSYYRDAVDYLLGHPKIISQRAGIIGVSMGAGVAMLISIMCHEVRLCIEISGSDVMMGENIVFGEHELHACVLDFSAIKTTKAGHVTKHCWDKLTASEHEKHGIPIEYADCDFLMIHGTDDQASGISAAEYLPKRLERHGKTNYRLLLYPGAGHLIEPPHSPCCYASYNKMMHGLSVWGGSAREHARAQENAWKQTLHAIKTKIGNQRDDPKSQL